MANITVNDKIKNALNIYHSGLNSKLDDTFQKQVSGKGLSTNDFTDALKEKLENISVSEGGAEIDLSNYVQKDGDKVLSSNDFTDELKTKLEGLENVSTDTFVAKVSGKDLSSNDFTDELKTKLEGLENVSTDTFVAKVSGKDLSSNDFTDELKTKLEGLETDTGLTFASGNVQPEGTNILWLDTSEES